MVSHAYKFSGIVCRNKENPSIPLFSGREDDTAAAQLETGAIMQIGAAVASMIYASFARVIYLMRICNRSHNRTDRKTVEIIINKN